MSGSHEAASQLYLERMLPPGEFYFYEGALVKTYLCEGYLTGQVRARITKRKMRTGWRKTDQLTVYKSLTETESYFDGVKTSLPIGTKFGAYQKDRHEKAQSTL